MVITIRKEITEGADFCYNGPLHTMWYNLTLFTYENRNSTYYSSCV